ncbi:uncharacterized protein LOC114255842 [Camellia sinensis]|uniref:uncharacterized protein LOC114255842 n=1 Tax=Camellia sinensis TaxID=4442 RepID=UPI00103691B5|nr:uncharacterized protein LOC114255842 [Camellia sinensis]
MKQQNLTGRKELGEFCEQFAYEPGIKYPAKPRKVSHKKQSKPIRRKSHKTYQQKPSKKFYSKKASYTGKRKEKSKSEIKCYKCGQIGHYANRCKSKVKSKINELNLDPDIKRQLLQTIEEESTEDESPSEDEVNELFSPSSSDEEQDEPLCPCSTNQDQLSEINYWKSIVEMNGLHLGEPNSINVLTDAQKDMLAVADQIQDPEIKIKYLKMCYEHQQTVQEQPLIPLKSKKSETEVEQTKEQTESSTQYLLLVNQVTFQKWYIKVSFMIQPDFWIKDAIALVDSGADMNYIQEGIVPTRYFQKTTQSLTSASGNSLQIRKLIKQDIGKSKLQNRIVIKQRLQYPLDIMNGINGFVISAPKMQLFQTTVRYLGHNISNGSIIPINRSIEFASKFPDEIKDKTQLQRFLGSLNYIRDYYHQLSADANILYTRLRKNPPPWDEEHTLAVRRIKAKVQQIPCLQLRNPNWKKIVETDASNTGFGGILKQLNPNTKKEELLRFHSGHWNKAALNYPTIKQECLAIVKCVIKFQDDLLNQHFLIKVDCSAAK